MRHIPIMAAAAMMLTTGLAQSAAPADVCTNLGEARTHLVALLGEADATKFDGYKAKIQAATSAVDANLASMAGGPDAAKADSFKKVWEAFKATRDKEIVPAVYAGDKDKAKGLATGIQAERLKEMKATMGCQ